MYRQLADERYVHTALFKDMDGARAALHDVKEAGISNEQLAVFVLQEEIKDPPPKAPDGGDGKHGLLLGLGIGGATGLLITFLYAQLSGMSGFFVLIAPVGLFSGMLIGGFSAGLYGMGLPQPSQKGNPVPPHASCLVTAKASDLSTILQVENIFKKHQTWATNG